MNSTERFAEMQAKYDVQEKASNDPLSRNYGLPAAIQIALWVY